MINIILLHAFGSQNTEKISKVLINDRLYNVLCSTFWDMQRSADYRSARDQITEPYAIHAICAMHAIRDHGSLHTTGKLITPPLNKKTPYFGGARKPKSEHILGPVGVWIFGK